MVRLPGVEAPEIVFSDSKCGNLTLTACRLLGRRTGAAGADRRRQYPDPAQCPRHHAGDRRADDYRRAGFAWWFRASNTRARYQPGFVYSGRIELIVWAIPLLVILFLGGVIWIGAHDLDPFKPIETQEKPVEVQVVSLDWKWLFVYPELGVASVNDLVVPVKAPVHFSLTSASVMNMFFVPQLGSMVATMNGMVTQLWLQADQTGELYGQSSQFSGDGFAGMNFIVHAVPPDRFQQWVADRASNGPALDAAGYHRAVAAEPERGAVHLPVGRGQPVRRHRQSKIPAGPRPAGE